jgi:sigma-B regulation protein RsbU (phosphoserine phosphatase)
MPDIDGLTLVKMFRENEATRETPLIVLSTKEEPKIKADAFALGANDYWSSCPTSSSSWRASATTPRATSTSSSATRPTGPSRPASSSWPRTSPRPPVRLLAPAREAHQGRRSGPTGGSSPRPSWAATRSATTGSTRTTSPSTCSTSAATASGRPCSRSRPSTRCARSRCPQTDFREPGQVLTALNKAFPMTSKTVCSSPSGMGCITAIPSLTILRGGHPPALLLTGADADHCALEALDSDGECPMIGACRRSWNTRLRHHDRRAASSPMYSDGLRDRAGRTQDWPLGDFVGFDGAAAMRGEGPRPWTRLNRPRHASSRVEEFVRRLSMVEFRYPARGFERALPRNHAARTVAKDLCPFL